MKWRLLDTGAGDARTNMALDQALLSVHERGSTPPTLRFYTWLPPAVSLGRHQKAADVLDLPACGRLGLDVVTRPTGGWAVLHDGDLCFSIAISRDCLPAGGVVEAYGWLARGIVRGMESLGLEAALIDNPGKGRPTLCCAAAAGSDIKVGGRKLIGSAQLRRRRALLQQSVLPLRPARAGFSTAFRDGAAAQTMAEAPSLSGLLGRDIKAEQVKEAISRGFCDALGAEIERGGLLDEEREELRRLLAS